MSDFAEKMERPTLVTGTVPRCTLAMLKKRWSWDIFVPAPLIPGAIVTFRGMEDECWRVTSVDKEGVHLEQIPYTTRPWWPCCDEYPACRCHLKRAP